MFASNASKLRFVPSEGMKVVVSGNVEVYERDGIIKFMLQICSLRVRGIVFSV